LSAPVALLCWGSTKGVCCEVGTRLGLRVVQPVVLSPFPVDTLKKALSGVSRVICVEENATAQLATLAGQQGITIHDTVLRFDGRPFTDDRLEADLKKVLS
jgi:2-oxoglutarate ferredoxin oxidoreductase subunit alpha